MMYERAAAGLALVLLGLAAPMARAAPGPGWTEPQPRSGSVRAGRTRIRETIRMRSIRIAGAEEVVLPRRSVNLVEGRVLMAMPAALPTGMTTGIEASYTRRFGRWLAWGVRASWSTATEYTSDYVIGWEVRNDDIRIRGLLLLQSAVGRALLALRLGVGTTVVYEGLTPKRGALNPDPRLPSAPLPPEKSGWRLLPAFELEPAVVLRLLRGWGLSLSGGPSLHILDGKARWGWISGLGVAWQR